VDIKMADVETSCVCLLCILNVEEAVAVICVMNVSVC